MNAGTVANTRLLTAGLGVVAAGLAVGLVAVIAMSALKPAFFLFAVGGIALFIPSLILRNAKAYWLFLLALSIPFDIYKRVSTWIVSPAILYDLYGMPASGTLSLDLYVTDVVLLAMVVPWLMRLCLRRERFHFPKVGYIYLLYLAWALFGALLTARSPYLAIIEWCRQLLYFLSFVYVLNNVVTRVHLRTVTWALLVALVIGASSVAGFFALGIGTSTSVFSGLYGSATQAGAQTLTIYEGFDAPGSTTKRSTGIFAHPALAASFLGLTSPIALALFVAARRRRDRLLYGGIFLLGFAALFLTFSRAGLVGLLAGIGVLIALSRWSGLISRQVFALIVGVTVILAVASAPMMYLLLEARPQSVSRRFQLVEITLAAYLKDPIIGVGLNNSSAAIKAGEEILRDKGREVAPQPAPVHYLVVLCETGAIGFILFFGFFWRVIAIALREIRTADAENKVLLIGVIGGLAALATQNFADVALGGHSINALLWLYTGLIFAIGRRQKMEDLRLPAAPAPRLRVAAGD